jgi:hypothetical protein
LVVPTIITTYVFEGVKLVVVKVNVGLNTVSELGKIKVLVSRLALTPAAAGETETVSRAGPTNRALEPLPFSNLTVAVTFVASPAVIFVVAGVAASTVQVLTAAEAR